MTEINIKLESEIALNLAISERTKGDAGVGVPIGGTAGQVLAKIDADDYNTEWVEQSGGGGGGAVDSVNGQTGVVVLAKADVGLGNVDNTTDSNKPISTATQTALDAIPRQANSRYVGYYSGYWYRTGRDNTISLSQGANVFRGGFFYPAEDIPIDALGIEVTASVTADYILGIYEIDTANPNVGTIAHQTPVQSLVAETGPKIVATTFTLLSGKIYVLGILSSEAISLRTAGSAGFAHSIGAISPQDSVSSGEMWGGNVDFAGGVPLLSRTLTSGITWRAPLVWFRRA